MFYSETLLQKNGPLARIWLSAHLERKLSKNQVLQSNIADSIAIIITPNQVPMSLRLSSQLLLGVVRVYRRKTHYLLDDCDNTWELMKIAFHPSVDHDIPVSLQLPPREALMLPNKPTPPPPDANLLLSQIEEVEIGPMAHKRRASVRDIYLPEEIGLSYYPSQEEELEPMEGLELELDFGIELGREAPAPRPIEEEMASELEAMPPEKEGIEGEPSLEFDLGDITMGGEEFEFHPADISRTRITESPLSEIDETLAQEIEAEYTALHEPQEEHDLIRRPKQRAKKRRILMFDEDITLSSDQIRQQQANRDSITKPTAFLPRDTRLAALMDMQKGGGFVSFIMMEGRSTAWAPELQGMLSLAAIRTSRELKRRLSVGPEVEQYRVSKSPRLELGTPTPDFRLGAEALGEETMAGEETMLEIPAYEEITESPALPTERRPMSIATEHAAHILREQFGPEVTSPGRPATSVLFQDLVPEHQSTKSEASKMFFECLVLASEDMIRVEQGPGLGDDIRMWAKEGLWT
ncbi:Rec8 like protein-domain-containing protein [Stachybotrys elegans]|uniref:Rec8 like protein-domain-containing protein n=1 Tax=Stachybotrys elegans TaxID=80388 RepID=A0A8K0SB45_9HYPO|nr:Rec8 like protein-domain-containing protein [Stachybotrys elegans]